MKPKAELKPSTIDALRSISAEAEDMGLSPHEIADALGKPHDMLSLIGAYYRVQSFLLHFTGTVGATIFPIIGVVTALWAMKNAVKSVVNSIKTAVGSLIALSAAQTSVTSGLLSIFKLAEAAVVNDGDGNSYGSVSPDALLMSMSAIVPPQVSFVVNSFSSALSSIAGGGRVAGEPQHSDNVAQNRPKHNSSDVAAAATLPGSAQPVSTLANMPVAQPAAPKKAAPSGNDALETAGITLGAQLAGALINAIVDEDPALDGEVRDGEVRDADPVAAAVAQAAMDMGCDSSELLARAQSIASHSRRITG